MYFLGGRIPISYYMMKLHLIEKNRVGNSNNTDCKPVSVFI